MRFKPEKTPTLSNNLIVLEKVLVSQFYDKNFGNREFLEISD
jgi:hypothetical protein